MELVRLLHSRRTGLYVESGDPAALRGVRYLITLDSDTNLNVGAAREMIGAMMHPLNRPKIDRSRRVVVSGYGLLQPRISVDLEVAGRTQFSRIFAGQGGIDPYGSKTSDVYHDLFNEGNFTGKGIFDIEAYFACLDDRFPHNRVLSHYLLEWVYLHAGLIGDVELTDSYPVKVASYFTRLHRWVRGDWQAACWLFHSVRNAEGQREKNPLGGINRWKIFDNLRRSLSPVFTMLRSARNGVFRTRLRFGGRRPVLCAISTCFIGARWLSGAARAFRSRTLAITQASAGRTLQTSYSFSFCPQAWVSPAAVTALGHDVPSEIFLPGLRPRLPNGARREKGLRTGAQWRLPCSRALLRCFFPAIPPGRRPE